MRGEGCAAAPSAMAVDITLLFKASVKTVKTRNKALGVAAGDSARDELLKRGAARSKSDFTGRAREVVSAGRRKRGTAAAAAAGSGQPSPGSRGSEPRVPAARPPTPDGCGLRARRWARSPPGAPGGSPSCRGGAAFPPGRCPQRLPRRRRSPEPRGQRVLVAQGRPFCRPAFVPSVLRLSSAGWR